MKTDMPSFYAGAFVMLLIITFFIFVFNIDDWVRHIMIVPECPTEDSCYPEYENGQWHIIEGERPVEQYLLPN